jgi:hypothetical protein
MEYKKNYNNTTNKTKHTYREQDKMGKSKKDQTRLVKLKYELLKISTNVLTESAAETHLALGRWLEEQLMFRV